MYTIEDIIHGDRWRELCDCVVDSGIDPTTRAWVSIEYGLDEIYNKNCLIFCKTDFIDKVFDMVNKSKYKHILITGNSDYSVGETIFHKKPNNIVFWFAMNVTYVNDCLVSIPIGTERPFGGGSSVNFNTIINNLKNEKSGLVYMNHNDGNNIRARFPVTEKFRNCDWVTYEKNVSFEKYIHTMSSHKFVFSPNGNENCSDCVRTWEAMYLGTMPILTRSCISNFIENNIPSLVVDDLTSITKQQLVDHYQTMSKRSFNPDVLRFVWWKNLILRKREEFL